MNKIEKQLLRTLNKALANQDEHPLSNSANREVKKAESALAHYISEPELYLDLETL